MYSMNCCTDFVTFWLGRNSLKVVWQFRYSAILLGNRTFFTWVIIGLFNVYHKLLSRLWLYWIWYISAKYWYGILIFIHIDQLRSLFYTTTHMGLPMCPRNRFTDLSHFDIMLYFVVKILKILSDTFYALL